MNIEAYGHEFELVNEDKVARAVQGTLSRNATFVGGVGEDSSGEAKIVEYDRLGGGIRLGGDRVKPGCFYDFKGRKPFAEPTILLEFSINGKRVTVSADEPLPPLVRAAKEAEQGAEAIDTDTEGDETPNKNTPSSLIGGGKRKVAKKEAKADVESE